MVDFFKKESDRGCVAQAESGQESGEARRFLSGFLPHLSEGCINSIREIFDAEPRRTRRAVAWRRREVWRKCCAAG